MPRKPRIFSPTGIYHIILRSINQHIIFEEDADYQKMLFILSDCKRTFDIDIYAYCLMDNHIHLLIHSGEDHLASFFQSLGTRFVRWYNTKYQRSGHLFQDRYYSIPVEKEQQYLSTLAYIHNNPVKSSLCRYPSEYRWSSYNAFYGQKNPLVDTSFSFQMAGSKDLLLQFFTTDSTHFDDSQVIPALEKTRQFMPDKDALIIFKEVTKLSSTSEAVNLPKSLRNKYMDILHKKGLTHKQIARLMDVSVSTVKRCSK
ncbi:MAG: transposase [Lachnospiraceae bacterium]|nr:transposase [Lachnospiraceae bacterium]